MYIITTGIVLGLIILLIYLVIKYPDRSIGTRSRPDIDGIKGYPIIGNQIDAINIYIVDLLYKLLMEYGPLATFTVLGFGRFNTVSSPELLEHVLKTNFDDYVKGPLFNGIFHDLLGDGIFNVDGKIWKFQRKLSSHLFHAKNFRDIICVVFEEETKILLNILQEAAKNDDVIDLHDLFHRFTMDSFGKIIFGTNFECLTHPDKPVQFTQEIEFVQTVMDKRFHNHFWKFTEMFTDKGAKVRSACKRISEYAYQIIDKRKKNKEAMKDHKDILSLFMNAEVIDEENGNVSKLNDKELRDIILNFILAGRDTTAQAISWMMYSIIANPTVEEKLVKEVNSLLTIENPIPDYDNIKKFQYTQAVFYETLRLYPSVPKNAKLCIKDNVLPNGIPIYAGEWVIWSSWAMGRDKRIWGEDARKFIPERFLENENGLKPNQYKFNSFNAGPRLCLGQNFATIETITAVTAILRRFKLELLPGQKSPPDFAHTVTLRMKDPLMVKVHIR